MAQVPGLGLDQSQLADVINQQYKGYSQKQRNQMMQSAAATPDNWASITDQANKTATQPTEFLGAGSTSNIPTVSKDGQQWQRVAPEAQQDIAPWMQSNYTAPYTTDFGSYYDPTSYRQYQNAVKAKDWVNQYINPKRFKTETYTPTADEKFDASGWTKMQGATDEWGNTSPSSYSRQVQEAPITSWQQLMDTYGQTPAGGWSDANTKGAGSFLSRRRGTGNQSNPLQGWLTNSAAAPNFSLYGSGTPEDIQRGFNVLQRMSPQNIGEFWGLSPETKKGMLENPANALQFMRATANPANGDWLSIGAEGGYSGIDSYQFDPKKGMTVDPSRYLQIDNSSGGFLGSLNNLAEGIAKWTDPVFYKSMGGGTENSLWKDLTNEGLYSAVFNKLDPILDKIDPGHNWTQDQIAGLIGADTQKEAFNQIAPIVLAAVSYGVGGTAGNVINAATTANAVNSGDWVGAATGALNASGINPTSSAANYLKDAGFSPTAARMMSGIGAGTLTNLARGQDAKSALAGALFSGISGEAGRGVSQLLGPQLGEIGSKIVGGAAGGGLNSLFNQNSPVQGSLYGAMSGGLHGFLNSTDKQNNTFNKERDIQNRRQAQNLTKLAKLFVKK